MSDSDNSHTSDSSDSSAPEIFHHVYDKQELAVINAFKQRYFEATSPAARKNLAMVYIFPGLFNYWKGIGKHYTRKELRMKSEVCSSLNEFRFRNFD
jgi:hypothetical protein